MTDCKRTLTLTLIALVLLTSSYAAQAVRPSATSRAVEPPGPPVPLGPYAAVTIEAAEGLPTHTVYRPTDLSAFPAKDKLPIVVWGNGACRMDGLMYERYLTKIASHGFLIVVAGAKDFRERAAKAAAAAPAPAPAPAPAGAATAPSRIVGGGGTGGHLIRPSTGASRRTLVPAARCSARSTPALWP